MIEGLMGLQDMFQGLTWLQIVVKDLTWLQIMFRVYFTLWEMQRGEIIQYDVCVAVGQ